MRERDTRTETIEVVNAAQVSTKMTKWTNTVAKYFDDFVLEIFTFNEFNALSV